MASDLFRLSFAGALAALLALAPVRSPHALAQGAPPDETGGAAEADEAPAPEDGGPGDASEADGAAEAEPSEEDLARARQAFMDGVAAAEAGDFAEAAVQFETALAVRSAPAVRYNLGSAYFELGRFDEAHEQVRTVPGDEAAPAELRERAEYLLREIVERVALVTIRLGGQATGARLDGEDLPPEAFDQPVALMPGEHVLEGLRGEEVVTRRELNLRGGAEAFVDVSIVPSPEEIAALQAAADANAEAAARAEREAQEGRRKRRLIGGVVAGVVVVLAAVGVGLGVALADGGTSDPVQGDFEPGVIRW